MKRFLAAISILLGLAAFAPAVLAQVGAPDPSFAQQAGLSTIEDPRVAIVNIIRLAFGFLGIIAVLIVLYAGLTWMTAGGDEEKVSRAKKILTAGVIGLIITISAFGIASFIISRLTDAINQAGPGGDTGSGAGGGGFGGGSGGSYRPTAIQPNGDLKKRDVVVSITFNSAPTRDTSNINANVILEQAQGSGRQSIAYEVETVNNTIKLKPTTPCPAPNEAKRCLEPNRQYWVTVRAGLKSVGGSPTVNCGINAKCSATFKTGETVGTKLPTAQITSPTSGQSVPAGSIVQVQTRLGDENGVGTVEYSADGAFFGADGDVVSIGANTWTSSVNWDTAAFTPVKNVSLTAKVTNIDDDKGDAPAVNVMVRPAHCFNGSKDSDEAGPDCGGNDCGACQGGACTGAAACASGECVGSVCVESPRIADVQARDGKPGNLVTIIGARFGSSAGTVTFLGGTTPRTATLGTCTNAWSPTQIIVVVPEGAEDGPIRVTTSAGKSDATNDTNGAFIGSFDVNEVARPGICSINPLAAKVRDALTVSGSGFGASQGNGSVVFFQADASCALLSGGSSVESGAVPSWTETSLKPNVPTVPTGVSGLNYLVRASVGGQLSNPACFLALPPEAGTEPRIEAITPDKGSSGTYVSLRGTNFGTSGKVEFKSGAGTAYGDTTFPQQCSLDYWDPLSVTVKVPKTYTTPANTPVGLLAYTVKLIRADGRESNTVTFTVNTDPVPPGICRISPDNGPENLGVTLYGEGFGSVSSAEIPGALSSHPDTVTFVDVNARFIGLWRDAEMSTAVPVGAKSGPVRVRRFSGAAAAVSNGINFVVKDCRQAGNACTGADTCCGDGACRPAGECSETKEGGFAWQFSTGKIPQFPVVNESATCQTTAPTMMPSPNPFKGSRDVCTDIAEVTANFSLPMDRSTLTTANVVLESCGTGDNQGVCAPVTPSPAVSVFDSAAGIDSMISLRVGGGAIQPSTWYRLRIRDGVRSLATADRAAQQLDGDNNGQGGGEYLSTFKSGTTACEFTAVDVQPDPGLIDSSSQKLGFKAFPLSARCIILSCANRTAAWSSSDTSKATVNPAGGIGRCETEVSAVAETAPGPDIHILVNVDGKTDEADLKIDYANPMVQKYGPRDCTVACINTVPEAVFNTDMKTSGQGSILTSMHLKRCKNESCLAFEPASDVPAVVTYDNDSRKASLKPVGNLAANVFYRVIIDGAALSTSDAPLSGLNFENTSFSWIFRTRPSEEACGVQAVAIEPAQTVLKYIGQIGKVNAIPKTSPDACSADGQTLNSDTITWAWSESQTPATTPDAFTLAPYHPQNPPATLSLSAEMMPRCTSQCLYAGSLPVGTAVCGNGAVETGEECDTPNANGCSSRCLLAGNMSTTTCGDGTVQANLGETCDEKEKNGQAGSGCNVSCRLTGAVAGSSICGNGSIGLGESCDDSNKTSGDGCSSECLNEGSDSNVPVCGNGKLEEGEQCDWLGGGTATSLLTREGAVTINAGVPNDPKRSNFACAPSCLLRGTSGPSCGDGLINYERGESCDAGDLNGEPGTGCSQKCVKTGSEAFGLNSSQTIRAYCGDNQVTVHAGGGGEDCEAAGTAPKVSEKQYVTAMNRCSAGTPSCSGNVVATASGVSNDKNTSGIVTVECSCRHAADTGEDLNDCAAFGSGLACGAGACCFPRPALPTITPVGGDQCRNALVTVAFKEAMNDGSLAGNLFVVQDTPGCTVPGLAQAPGGRIASAWRSVKNFFLDLVGREVSAAACAAVQGEFQNERIVEASGRSYTVSTFKLAEPFVAKASYRVVVRGGVKGVKSANGVGYADNPAITQDFSTGNDICKLDAVEVSPSRELIQRSDRPAVFQAKAVTEKNGRTFAISPTSGYAWTLGWNLVPTTIVTFQPAPTGYAASVQAAAGKNGDVQVVATATMTQNTILPGETPEGSAISGKADVTVMLCENPWPSRDTATGAWSPYIDPETHFKFFYCRDKAGGDLLPDLKALAPGVHPVRGQSPSVPNLLRFCTTTKDGADQPKSCTSNAQCGGDVCAAKDLFFQFRDARIRDAIGVRVFSNERHLPLADWYIEQKFAGSPSPVSIDGYTALQDQKSLYVSAPDKYGDPEFRSYVYLFGVGDTADARVTEVFKLMTANLSFNTNISPEDAVTNVCKVAGSALAMTTCSSNLDCQKAFPDRSAAVSCDAPKDKIRRDARRWEQLVKMTADLSDVREQTGFFPRLEAGSFVRGMTVSKWPSWATSLGPAGAQVDPINAFNQCDKFGNICAATGKACVQQSDCEDQPNNECRPKFEAETCFDNKNAVFMCPLDSQVYIYQAIGGADYRLNADFESDPTIPWSGGCATVPVELLCTNRPECSWDGAASLCKSRIDIARDCLGAVGSTQGAALYGGSTGALCGNGIKEAGEECEIGQTAGFSCPTGSLSQTCSIACKWEPSAPNCAALPAIACGNGAVEIGESCDDGQQTGQYNRCRSGQALGCMKRCVDTRMENPDDNSTKYPNKIGGTCVNNAQCGPNAICTDRMNFCGDGVKNGNEACDEGSANGGYGHCSWDCKGAGPYCGDNVVQSPEKCDGNQETSAGVCVPTGWNVTDGFEADSSLTPCATNANCATGETCKVCAPSDDALKLPRTRTRSCNPDIGLRESNCRFRSWTACQASGSCGNGVVEGAEQCDKGSGNSDTGDCLKSCKKNVCNDGKVLAGIEQCDNGSTNGVRCTPGYGTNCNYCKQDCTVETISGAYCGDKNVTPPESCDPGSTTGWCSRTVTRKTDGTYDWSNVKSCGGANVPCGQGFCRKYVGSEPSQGPAPSPSCASVGDGGTYGCTCPSSYSVNPPQCAAGINCTLPISQVSCVRSGAPVAAVATYPGPLTNKRCSTGNDCGKDEFCDGGEGECLSYGSTCTAERYSTPNATPIPIDGACRSCSSSCVETVVGSPKSCGDSLVQPEFGEECDGVGDAFATGTSGTKYECAKECKFSGNAYCGNNSAETQFGEIFDQGNGATTLSRNGQITGIIRDAVDVQPVQGINVELWQGKALIDTKQTNSAGQYFFNGLETKNTCKAAYYIKIPATASGTFGNRLHKLPQNGYQAHKVPSGADVFSFRGPSGVDPNVDVKAISGTNLEMKDILLVPKLSKYEYLIVVDWQGSLGNDFLDLHMKRPGDPAVTQGTWYRDKGNSTLETGPHHAYLYCFHQDGSDQCTSFDTRPETMHFKFRSTGAGEPYFFDRRFDDRPPFRAWLTDYTCGGDGDDNAKSNCGHFQQFGTRVFVYTDKGEVGKFTAPPAGSGGYWRLFEVTNKGEFRPIDTTSSGLSW